MRKTQLLPSLIDFALLDFALVKTRQRRSFFRKRGNAEVSLVIYFPLSLDKNLSDSVILVAKRGKAEVSLVIS